MLKEVEKKIAVNAAKYPVDKAKGSSKKYSALDWIGNYGDLDQHGFSRQGLE